LKPHPGRTGDLHWVCSGVETAPPLVLLHSLGTDIGMWDQQLPILEGSRRVIRIDLPGHGSSSARPGPYTLAALGEDVVGLLEDAAIGPFDLAGVSLGGLISLWIAIECGERVSSLIAANTAARLGSVDGWEARIEAVRREGMGGVRDAVVARFYAPEFARRWPAEFDSVSRAFAGIDPIGYTGCCAALRDADLSARVSEIKSRSLVIGGSLDVATPPDQARSLHEAIEGSRLEIIEGAGHLANQDSPESFNRLMAEFLAL
jgi:3-oxoadipate enol-lactonase